MPVSASIPWAGLYCFYLAALTVGGFMLFVFMSRFSGPTAQNGAAWRLHYYCWWTFGRADLFVGLCIWNTALEYSGSGHSPLADKPHEHRVGALVWADPKDRQFSTLLSLYGTAWKQALFWYHNIQCVDVIARNHAWARIKSSLCRASGRTTEPAGIAQGLGTNRHPLPAGRIRRGAIFESTTGSPKTAL